MFWTCGYNNHGPRPNFSKQIHLKPSLGNEQILAGYKGLVPYTVHPAQNNLHDTNNIETRDFIITIPQKSGRYSSVVLMLVANMYSALSC